jgi:hypothetical protein
MIGSAAVRTLEIVTQRDPCHRGKRLRARIYARNDDEAFALRLLPEFMHEELTDPEISRLIGCYRESQPKLFRLPPSVVSLAKSA